MSDVSFEVKSVKLFTRELSDFEYQDPVLKDLLTGNRPNPKDVDTSHSVSAVAVADWSRRYTTKLSPELLARSAKWFYHDALTLEDVSVLIERGELSLAGVTAAFWPYFYTLQREDGKRQSEVIDEWFIDELFDVFGTVIARPSSENAAQRDRIIGRFVEFDKEWGPLLPIKSTPNELPIDGMPVSLSTYIREVADKTEVGQDMVTGVVIGALGAAVTGTVRVQITPDHSEPLNPAMLMLSTSAERKSSTNKLVTRELSRIEKDLASRDKSARVARVVDMDMLKKQIGDLERLSHAASKDSSGKGSGSSSGSNSGNSSGSSESKKSTHSVAKAAASVTATDKDIRDKKILLEYLDAPVRQYSSIIADATPEAFVESLSLSWSASVSIIADEATFFAQAAGLYGGKDKSQPYLIAISGDELRSRRKGTKEDVIIPMACANLILMLQPVVFDSFIRHNRNFIHNGMLPRLNTIFPEHMAGRRTHEKDALNDEVLSQWDKVLYGIKMTSVEFIEKDVRRQEIDHAASTRPPEYDYVLPRMIRLSSPGRVAWTNWKKQTEPELKPGGRLHPISSWAVKAQSRVVVLAALFTLADEPHAEVVDDKYVPYCIRLVEGLSEHALFAMEYGDGIWNSQLLAAIQKLHIDEGVVPGAVGVTTSMVNAKVRGLPWMKGAPKGHLDEMLQSLSDLGYIKVVEVGTGGRGRKRRFVTLRPFDLG